VHFWYPHSSERQAHTDKARHYKRTGHGARFTLTLVLWLLNAPSLLYHSIPIESTRSRLLPIMSARRGSHQHPTSTSPNTSQPRDDLDKSSTSLEMQNAYSYSPQMPHGDPYRHPSTVAPMHQAVSLPPLRAMEGHVHHMGYPTAPPMAMTSPPIQGYYTHAPPVMTLPGPPMMPIATAPGYARFPIPMADHRILAGRPTKKEIKRRTKTGCLTCRKRRIKVR